jgi:phosphoglycerol transferase MdoB-like AlkP superfamily enzyme
MIKSLFKFEKKMKKIEKNDIYSFCTSFYLLLILLLIRFNKIFYSIKEFGFQIKSFADFVYVILAIFQDFFFCFFLFLLMNYILKYIKSKKAFIIFYVSVISICYFILLYNIADLIYFKTSGISISWGAIKHADHIMSLWDSAILYVNFYLIFILILGFLSIGPGSFISTKYLLIYKDKINFKNIHIIRKFVPFIIIFSIFFFSQIFLYSLKPKAEFSSIPVFHVVGSIFSKTKNNDLNENQNKLQEDIIELEKLNRNSELFPISIVDRKTQKILKEKLKKIKEKRFNVIFYLTESTYAKYYPMYGAEKNVSPFLAEKSKKSLVLKNCYSVGVRSMNSIISLLTGLGGYPGYQPITFINPQIKTPALSQMLKKEGYNSACIHSGNFAFYKKQLFLYNRDFDHLVDETYLKKMYPDAYYSSWGIDDRVMIQDGLYWIDKQINNNKNFFITFIPIFPHHPYKIPDDVPKINKSPKNRFEHYQNSLYFVDLIFQKLYAGLEERGLLENTIIVFVADHGEAFGQHEGNFGHENYIYEENVRIPGIIFNPQLFDNFNEFEGIVNQADIFATIVDILGLEIPVGCHGESILNMNTGKIAFFACGESNVDIGLRDGNYKAIYNYNSNTINLFDLNKHEFETEDISMQNPKLTKEYKNRLLEFYNFQKNYIKNFDSIVKKYIASQKNQTETSLLDIEPYFAIQEYFRIEKNKSSEYKSPLIINGIVYDNGYGVHANCIMKFNVSGLNFKRFKGMAGKLEKITVRNNFLEMQVILDGKLAFSTGKLTTYDEGVPFDLNIKDVDIIELVVLDAGDTPTNDEAAWINPVLIR